MRSPSPARRRSPGVAGAAGSLAERRHAGSRRLSCSALLLLALAGALGAHPANGAELARQSEEAPSSSGIPATTAGAASLVASLALALAPPIAGPVEQNGASQGLSAAASVGDAVAMAGAAEPAGAPHGARDLAATAEPATAPAASPTVGTTPPPLPNNSAAEGASLISRATGAGAAAASPAPGIPPAAASKPAPTPHPALGFDAAFGVPRRPFGKLIYQIARSYALNPLLVAAIAKVESDFNPHARSRKGAYGLMQVLPSTARRFGLPRKRDLLNPRKNLETASRYLRWLVDRFGDDPVRVLAAYNAGEGAVDRFGGVPPFSETRDYVQRIFGLLGFSVLLDAPAAAPAVASAAAALAGVAGAR
jgi:soluble lytic murein transglycosylase-like protein